MISPNALAQRDSLAREFLTAKPFRHVVIEDFLDNELCRRILADFPSFDERYARNEMGKVGGKAARTDVRDVADCYRELDAYIQGSEFLDYVSAVTDIPDLLYDPDYVGGGTHENRHGQGLDQHVDFNFHPGTRWHRRLNLIVYLNPEWSESWGGNLQLQADPWTGDTSGPTIAPRFNRAVLFETTERSWHGFSKIELPEDHRDLSRKSFAIYLYTKDRPAEETAVSHATVYVPDGMPEELEPGQVLSQAQHGDLKRRFEQLRGQLKFLYDREKRFESRIGSLERALENAKAGLRLPLQGYATQPRAPSGIWADGWVGKEFSVCFVPQRRVRSVQIEMWISPQLEAHQTFEIELNGKRWQHHASRGGRSQASLQIRMPAGLEAELRITAGHAVVPSEVSDSTDMRELAWKLIAAILTH